MAHKKKFWARIMARSQHIESHLIEANKVTGSESLDSLSYMETTIRRKTRSCIAQCEIGIARQRSSKDQGRQRAWASKLHPWTSPVRIEASHFEIKVFKEDMKQKQWLESWESLFSKRNMSYNGMAGPGRCSPPASCGTFRIPRCVLECWFEICNFSDSIKFA